MHPFFLHQQSFEGLYWAAATQSKNRGTHQAKSISGTGFTPGGRCGGRHVGLSPLSWPSGGSCDGAPGAILTWESTCPAIQSRGPASSAANCRRPHLFTRRLPGRSFTAGLPCSWALAELCGRLRANRRRFTVKRCRLTPSRRRLRRWNPRSPWDTSLQVWWPQAPRHCGLCTLPTLPWASLGKASMSART